MDSESKIEINESKSNLAVPEVYLENGTGNIKTRFRSNCQDKPENVVIKENTTCSSTATKVDNRHSKKLKVKCKWFFKKLVLFLVSHIGLTCIVVGYSILGAILFQHLEAPNEEKSRLVISQVRDKRRQEIWNATKTFNVIYEGNWSEKATEILVNFQKDIFQITKEQGWDGMNEGELYWSFPGALLYSVTVITTIGYGHITPKTKEGRIATMLYALLGIPLTLLCLANIGRTMGKGFRGLYNKVAVIVLDRRLKIFSREKSKTQIHFTNGATANGHSTSYASTSNTGSKKPEVHLSSNVPVVHHKKRTTREVPISLCLLIAIGYNLLGSLLFGLWEKEWGFLNGIYFCFITLSTIGFGDIVPGHSLESWQSHEKQVICTLYLLFGLALVAMCFDLMQTQVRLAAKKLAVKMGLLEDEKYNETESTSLEVNPEQVH